MARHDVLNDPTPVNSLRRPSLPTITSLRTALAAFSATSYSTARLDDMTENDMVYASKLHGLTVTGL